MITYTDNILEVTLLNAIYIRPAIACVTATAAQSEHWLFMLAGLANTLKDGFIAQCIKPIWFHCLWNNQWWMISAEFIFSNFWIFFEKYV